MSQIRPDGLPAALERGLPPVVWIHGDEPLLVLEAADATRAAARAQGRPNGWCSRAAASSAQRR